LSLINKALAIGIIGSAFVMFLLKMISQITDSPNPVLDRRVESCREIGKAIRPVKPRRARMGVITRLASKGVESGAPKGLGFGDSSPRLIHATR